jgi:hypothetical protein
MEREKISFYMIVGDRTLEEQMQVGYLTLVHATGL